MACHPLISAVLILLVAVTHWGDVECRSSGAPSGACSTLAPLQSMHLNAPPQGTPVPYEVDLSSLDNGNGSYSYLPGATYSLTVRSTDGSTFRGVLLQGRVMADDTTPAGTFEASDSNLRLSDCPTPAISVTHNNPTDKSIITTTWTAPPVGTGTLRIGFAVVRVRAVYWANQRTSPISERELECLPGSMSCPYYQECFPFFLGATCLPPPIGECTCVSGFLGQMCCPPYLGCYPAGIEGAACPPPPTLLPIGNCTCSTTPGMTGQMCCPPYAGCFGAGILGVTCPPPPLDVEVTTDAATDAATDGQQQISGNGFFCIAFAAILMLLGSN